MLSSGFWVPHLRRGVALWESSLQAPANQQAERARTPPPARAGDPPGAFRPLPIPLFFNIEKQSLGRKRSIFLLITLHSLFTCIHFMIIMCSYGV